MFSTKFLLASLLWSSVATGYWVYGKRQQSFTAMSGGILMFAASWVITSALLMSLACIGIMGGVYYLVRLGY